MFERLSSSTLSPSSQLILAQTHLEGARKQSANNQLDVALELYDQAEVSFVKVADKQGVKPTLTQVKEALRNARTSESEEAQNLREQIAAVYLERGDAWQQLGKSKKAEANYQNAEKWGHPQAQQRLANLLTTSLSPTPSRLSTLSRASTPSMRSALLQSGMAGMTPAASPHLVNQSRMGRDPIAIPAQIFSDNVSRPLIKVALPGVNQRLTDTQQLAYGLALLQTPLSDDMLTEEEEAWRQTATHSEDELERLSTLTTDVLRAFVNDKPKNAASVAEVVCLTSVLQPDEFKSLLAEMVDGIKQATLLDMPLLTGLAQLIRHAPAPLEADDLVKILTLLSERLQATHGQANKPLYQLTWALSHVLDAMNVSEVTGLNREQLHAPLTEYLKGLQSNADPYFVYQAAYACQALQYVGDDETVWQAALRRTSKVLEGIFGMMGAVKGIKLNEFIAGVENIYEGTAGAIEAMGTLKDAYDGVCSLYQNGQGLIDSLKEGFSLTRKSAWYAALRGIDALVENGQLAEAKQLISEVSCRRHPAFQWGLCERLGQIAADPRWEASTRQEALAFLSEIYQNDAIWGQQASIKQWIIKIVMQLADASVSQTAASTLLADLKQVGEIDKQTLYQTCVEEGPGPYPVSVASPKPSTFTLLNRVQNKLEVETDVRQLKHRQTHAHSEAVYISPQGKPSLQASEETLFDLTERVKGFLEENKKKVFLLLGDSGAGKSTFNRRLEAGLWQVYRKGARIPLFITLPAIDKPEYDLIAKHLRKEGFSEPQIKELKTYREFIVICDGYDESQQTHNLYMSNRLNQPGEWQAQMVISCRSEYLGADYRDRFQPTDRNHRANAALFEEAVIAPFSAQKIDSYIDQYVQLEQPIWSAAVYQQALKGIPHLQELVRNPFLLTLTLEVLPSLVGATQDFSSARITRVALYDQFVVQWLERGKKRLAEKTLSGQKQEAFERLTKEGFIRNGLAFLTNLATAIYERQAGNPVVEYARLVDQKTWKEEFFGWEDEKQLLLEANPLTSNGNQYRFIHKSLLEYSVARAIFEPQAAGEEVASAPPLTRRGSMDSVLSFESQHAADDVALAVEQPLLDSLLARKNLVGEPSILQFLAERVSQEPLFKQQLHAVIERSKTDPMVRKAAANAITILVRAGVQFNGADLKGIQIPGADLSDGVFDSADLQGADLRKVNFRKSWLRQANLSGAKMEGVRFGEWPYLQEESEVTSCAYSPDGKACAVGLRNGTISVYDTSSWEKICTLQGHTSWVRSVVYSPSGQQIASGSSDKTVRLWDAHSGEPGHTLQGHTSHVLSVAYSPSGQQIASGSSDKTVRLWDAHSGEPGHTLQGHTDSVRSVVYSPSGQQIASGSWDQTVRLWDAHSGEPGPILEGHTSWVKSVVYSPSGQQIASGSDDQTVRLWDAHSGEPGHSLQGHTGWVNSVVYSPSGQQIASGSWDQTVRLWDAHSGEPGHSLQGHTNCVNSVVYSPSGQQIVSGSDDKTVRLWDAHSGEPGLTLQGHTRGVLSVVYSPSGQQIASGSLDHTVRLWDVRSGEPGPTLEGHTWSVNSVVYSPSGQQIASGSWDQTVRLWDAHSGEAGPILQGHTASVTSVVYSPSGQQIASGSDDKTVRLWNAHSGEPGPTLQGHTGWVTSVVYSPNGQQIASGSDDKTVRLWDAHSGEADHTLEGHTGRVNSVVYSPSGQQIVSGSDDNTVRLWDAHSGEPGHTLQGHTDRVTSVVYSPSGQQIASGSWDKMVRLWDAHSGEAGPILQGHTASVLSVVYSPSGQQIASGSPDQTVRLWDTTSGQCLAVVRGFQGSIYSLAWKEIADSSYLVTGCGDQSVRAWQVIEEEGRYQVRLSWSTTHDRLILTDTAIQDVQGLSPVNKKLLQQRGAVGEPQPAARLREASKKVAHLVSGASGFRLTPSGRKLNNPPMAAQRPSVEPTDQPTSSMDERHVFSHLA